MSVLERSNYNKPFENALTPKAFPLSLRIPKYICVNHFLGRRRLSLNKTVDSFTAAELDQVRTLEEEKIRLQRQLQDAKGALDAYAGKIGQQQVSQVFINF